jgi:tetratricopeptide (TPR) repeat protein/mono/diheme cytochrome c family protein
VSSICAPKTTRVLFLAPKKTTPVPFLLLLFVTAQPARAQTTAQTLPAENVTYTRHIAPILLERCTECHRPGGGAPFSLLTYEDAQRRAGQIAEVTRRRDMPPWKPVADHGGPFLGDRRLSHQQIDAIARWVDLGTPEGNPADRPALNVRPEGWRFGVPDLVVHLPRPYVLPAESSDVFRNFAIPLPVAESRCVRGIEFRPGSQVVHHANMLIDRTRTSRRFDDQDPEPGYDGPLPPDAEYPDGHFLGWTPGQAPAFLPEDMCWRLEAGSDLLLQMHLRSSGKPEEVQPEVAFFFSQRPATRIPVMLRLSRQDIDIAAGERSFRVSDAYVLPVDAEVHAVQPHAHYLAREIRAFAELPDGSVRWLVRITDWDFNWQDVYRYASPFWLSAGTRLVMEYSYDNSAGNARNPHHPPRRVLWGQQTTDEMGDLWIQVLTRNDRDRLRLAADARNKALREDIVGHRMMLRSAPGDAALHESLAKSYLQVGELDEALRHIQESVRLKPDSAVGQYNLGTALAALGRRDEAIVRFTEAVRLDPNLAYAHNSLGVSLYALGRASEAVAHFRRAIAIEPAYANAHNNLGKALEGEGELEQAILHYREAIRIQPDNTLTQQNLAGILVRLGKIGEAVGHYRRVLELTPDSANVAGRLAWILATHGDRGIGTPQEAIQLAERAVSATGRRDAVTLDILGAAYASGGRFDAAIEAAQSALDLALAARADELVRGIQTRLTLYRQHRPYRDP